jgi:hypothetical protein
MARRKTRPKSVKTKAASSTLHPERGMPAENSIKEVANFVSPQGVHYKILKTTETDAYDPPLAPPKKGGKQSTPPKS